VRWDRQPGEIWVKTGSCSGIEGDKSLPAAQRKIRHDRQHQTAFTFRLQ
jgi:hypothetical protein